MQYKIPQEVDVEDKIIGPFTLKGFAFVFVAGFIAILLFLVFNGAGLPMVPALILSALLGSFPLIFGFVPFNGKPIYTYSGHFMNFLFKPRQRVWKKSPEIQRKAEEKAKAEEEVKKKAKAMAPPPPPQKENLQSVESQIQEISLMVDTGGAYGVVPHTKPDPSDILERNNQVVAKEIESARKAVEEKLPPPEPTVSKMASVDPKKKFEYEKPRTSSYKLDEVVEKKEESKEIKKF